MVRARVVSSKKMNTEPSGWRLMLTFDCSATYLLPIHCWAPLDLSEFVTGSIVEFGQLAVQKKKEGVDRSSFSYSLHFNNHSLINDHQHGGKRKRVASGNLGEGTLVKSEPKKVRNFGFPI